MISLVVVSSAVARSSTAALGCCRFDHPSSPLSDRCRISRGHSGEFHLIELVVLEQLGDHGCNIRQPAAVFRAADEVEHRYLRCGDHDRRC